MTEKLTSTGMNGGLPIDEASNSSTVLDETLLEDVVGGVANDPTSDSVITAKKIWESRNA